MKRTIPYFLILTLLALTLSYKVWAERSSGQGHSLSFIPPLDHRLGDWQGMELMLDPDVKRLLNPDHLVYRRYQGPGGVVADLYGVFYAFQRPDQTMHAPTNCYPGAGWEIEAQKRMIFENPHHQGGQIPVTKLLMRKGSERIRLYFWYYAGGTPVANQVLNKFWTLYNTVVHGRNDGGLITVSTTLMEGHTESILLEQDFIPRVMVYFSRQSVAKPGRLN